MTKANYETAGLYANYCVKLYVSGYITLGETVYYQAKTDRILYKRCDVPKHNSLLRVIRYCSNA
jgi:hypothetical protein